MERWKGRVALVTGASVGIGAAVARALVQQGMKVVGCARNVDKIESKDMQLGDIGDAKASRMLPSFPAQGDFQSSSHKLELEADQETTLVSKLMARFLCKVVGKPRDSAQTLTSETQLRPSPQRPSSDSDLRDSAQTFTSETQLRLTPQRPSSDLHLRDPAQTYTSQIRDTAQTQLITDLSIVAGTGEVFRTLLQALTTVPPHTDSLVVPTKTKASHHMTVWRNTITVFGDVDVVLRAVMKLAAECQSAGYTGTLIPYKCDLSNEEEILSMFSAIKTLHQGVDVCINNAGLAHNEPLLSGRTDGWRNMIDVNVLALAICTREAYQSMKERNVDDGHIININSMGGHRMVASADEHFYCATKYAVTALTEGLRQELREAKTHIRATSISPGIVETEFAFRHHNSDPEKAAAVYESIKVSSERV
ncbi:hypothetical protein NFI96_016148, partial [Prochilodus magdalenae]